MTTHFYAFGSICRGEIDSFSDIDLLACVSVNNRTLDSERFSVYRYKRLRQMWRSGNPFAWHLHLESRLIYSSDGTDYLVSLGQPSKYSEGVADCNALFKLYSEAVSRIFESSISVTFNLSCIFLAIRNFAICYSLHKGNPIFSRRAPLLISSPLQIESDAYVILQRARILSSRGKGSAIESVHLLKLTELDSIISEWMNRLLKEIES